jgi:hypothetical protein
MFSDLAIEIFEQAEECRLEAQKAVNAEEKAAWLALAEDWLRLPQSMPVNTARDEPVTSEQTLALA